MGKKYYYQRQIRRNDSISGSILAEKRRINKTDTKSVLQTYNFYFNFIKTLILKTKLGF